LPQSELVTSFEGKHGYIRYYLKVELDQPWSFTNNLKKRFTVINPIDINEMQYLVNFDNRNKLVSTTFKLKIYVI